KCSANHPTAGWHLRWLDGMQRRANPSPGIRDCRQAGLRLRPGGRQESKLAGDISAVEVRVVSLDQLVRNGDHVASLYLYPRAIWLEALKRPRPRERRSRSPLHGGAVPRGGDVEDFQAEVGERVEQRAEVLAHSVGRDHV